MLLMTSLNTNLYLLLENLLFLVLATSFIVIVGWAWRYSKPFSLLNRFQNGLKSGLVRCR
jgi:Tfp pilus assembly protein PilO